MGPSGVMTRTATPAFQPRGSAATDAGSNSRQHRAQRDAKDMVRTSGQGQVRQGRRRTGRSDADVEALPDRFLMAPISAHDLNAALGGLEDLVAGLRRRAGDQAAEAAVGHLPLDDAADIASGPG